MANQNNTLLRQWQMLRQIPRYPLKITARTVLEKLESDGFKVTKRTVERDLNELSSSFPLALDDRDKPYGWSWQKDAPSFDLPGIDSNEALTLVMVEQHLKSLLPNSTIAVLEPYFKTAHKHLNTTASSNHVKSWLNKVRTVQPNQTLLPPKIKPEVQQLISEALLSDRQVEIEYKRRKESKISTHRIHPLALIQRGGLIYLYVRFFDYVDIKIIALHRIHSVKLLDMTTNIPQGFDIDHEVAHGRFDFGTGSMIDLKAKFTAEAGEHLFETPLSNEQHIDVMEDGALMVSAKVADTPQLVWWLLGLGDGVEVLEPLSIRDHVINILKRAINKYQP